MNWCIILFNIISIETFFCIPWWLYWVFATLEYRDVNLQPEVLTESLKCKKTLKLVALKCNLFFSEWCRSDRTKNHRWHIRRLGSTRWGCFLRQRLHESWQICGLRSALGGEISGESGALQEVLGAGGLCHWRCRATLYNSLRLRNVEVVTKGIARCG